MSSPRTRRIFQELKPKDDNNASFDSFSLLFILIDPYFI